ncbi:MAG: ELM1/GtrOC1 family putative glycosyltransferase [Candidatus Omnitrophota bacterium]
MYYLAKFFRTIFLRAPLWCSLWLGNLVGCVLYYNLKKRRIAFKNLKSVFPQKSNAEIRHIIRKHFNYLALAGIESMIAPRILKYVTVKGLEHIDKDGGILVAIHEGSWEIYNYLIASRLKYKMFAKEQKKKHLDAFLGELRAESSLELTYSLKDAVRSLHNGYVIGMVIDHGAEDNALTVQFFTHMVPTPSGAVYLAKKLNKKIYPCFGYREKDFSSTVEIGKPIDPQSREDADILRELNCIYERYLEKYPWEYLWCHKRFKRKKDLDIAIISDAKPGHLKQSKAFVSIFSEEEFIIRSKIINIQYKNALARIVAETCALFSCKACTGCGSCLKWLLSKRTKEEIEHTYADIVVSTGSTVAPVNKIMAASLGAKSVVILRPNIPLRKFDLSIIPLHDRIEGPRTVKIKGALTYPAKVTDKINECRGIFSLSEKKKVAFFLGGPISDTQGYTTNLATFVMRLKEFCLTHNYGIIASTSRRTPKILEMYVEKELAPFKNTEAIVYPSRQNYDCVFDGFSSLADIVFVTSESISMISEIAALGKLCVCVLLEKHIDKHKVFLESLENDVNFLDKPYNIGDIKSVTPSIFNYNKKAVREGIRRLL